MLPVDTNISTGYPDHLTVKYNLTERETTQDVLDDEKMTIWLRLYGQILLVKDVICKCFVHGEKRTNKLLSSGKIGFYRSEYIQIDLELNSVIDESIFL